ncbi:hypothetical protein HAX54_014509, partial [Datura stramonium]|nr:hypothetical protein [Datura stramonium]
LEVSGSWVTEIILLLSRLKVSESQVIEMIPLLSRMMKKLNMKMLSKVSFSMMEICLM